MDKPIHPFLVHAEVPKKNMFLHTHSSVCIIVWVMVPARTLGICYCEFP